MSLVFNGLGLRLLSLLILLEGGLQSLELEVDIDIEQITGFHSDPFRPEGKSHTCRKSSFVSSASITGDRHGLELIHIVRFHSARAAFFPD